MGVFIKLKQVEEYILKLAFV